jgi:hypothetical protein
MYVCMYVCMCVVVCIYACFQMMLFSGQALCLHVKMLTSFVYVCVCVVILCIFWTNACERHLCVSVQCGYMQKILVPRKVWTYVLWVWNIKTRLFWFMCVCVYPHVSVPWVEPACQIGRGNEGVCVCVCFLMCIQKNVCVRKKTTPTRTCTYTCARV